MTEIKPKFVVGEPLCSDECPCYSTPKAYESPCWGMLNGYVCWAGVRQQRDDALAENVVLRDLFQQQSEILKQIYEILQSAEVKVIRPPLIKAELGCMTCRNDSRKVTDTYCDGCELRGGLAHGSKWQPLR
jgi:hypothetical protein